MKHLRRVFGVLDAASAMPEWAVAAHLMRRGINTNDATEIAQQLLAKHQYDEPSLTSLTSIMEEAERAVDIRRASTRVSGQSYRHALSLIANLGIDLTRIPRDGITVTPTHIEITFYALDADGHLYVDGDDIATHRIRIPIRHTPTV